jgi:ATP-dependent Clp protease ATP-binding subunit ClpA
MKLCALCNKNIATIFTAKIQNGKSEMMGLCIPCAKKMGFPITEQFMEQAGFSPEDYDNLAEQMESAFEDIAFDRETEQDKDDTNFLNNLISKSFPIGKKENNKGNTSKDSKSAQNTENQTGTEPKNRKKKSTLDMYGMNLTEKAMNQEVDRVIGRHKEIDRIIQILNRRTKNNPILIGEPGVGKTAIAEGLAVRVVEKQVPAKLFGAEIYLLDLTSVVAGTQFRGQFEGRMKAIIEDAKKCGNIILVIDEVHNVIGAGEAQGGALNAANILKPALARGEIQVIGATTLDEYRKHIEKDSALERRFQPVLVEEPSIEEAIEILKGIKKYYESYHKVIICDDVINAAVYLSNRYITDRYLPDKAIDVIDEASSRANLKNQGLIELKTLEEELEEVLDNIQEASNNSDFEKAAKYRVEEFKIRENINNLSKESIETKLTVEDIAYVIEAWTKIPIQRITEEEANKLLDLENRLHKRVVGQHKAIVSLSRAIRRNRIGFRKKKKPTSFIFAGPTGVGKTELVKALACELFGSEEALIRIDMSEYMEKHTVSKLIGAPPGYIGYDEGGQLTEKVRRKPYSVILLDEIEKAHPDVYNMLLQILEDGRLTDSQGRTVFFDNTLIIMTSNAGTQFKSNEMGFAKEGYNVLESGVEDALKEIFRPEFLNRIDDIIIFNRLSRLELFEILDLMLEEVSDEISEKNISMEITQQVKDYILQIGYDDKYGARPLRRAIQKLIEDEIAEQYLQGKFADGSHIIIELVNDTINIR